MINAKRVNSDSNNTQVQIEIIGNSKEIAIEATAILVEIGKEKPEVFLAVMSKALEILADEKPKE